MMVASPFNHCARHWRCYAGNVNIPSWWPWRTSWGPTRGKAVIDRLAAVWCILTLWKMIGAVARDTGAY
jgi:hypothetical protein